MMNPKRTDLSPLLDGENIIPVSLEEYVEGVEKRITYLNNLLVNELEGYERFRDYLHDPFVKVEAFYDADTDSYVLSVIPQEGKEYQKAINERLRIK